MRTLTSLICSAGLLLGVFVSGVSAQTPEIKKLQEQALQPVVQLNRTCSASIIYSSRDDKSGDVTTLALTAKHCVDGDTGLLQTLYVPVYQDGRIVKEDAYKAKVKGVSYASDLALLVFVDTETFFERVVKLAPKDEALFEGEPAWTVGYSRGQVRTITDGLFGSRSSIPFPDPARDTEYFRSTPQIAGGNSGGALFHKNADGDYVQIGVAAAAIPASDFMGYYTPIDAIHDYLKVAAPEALGLKSKTARVAGDL